MKKTSLFNKTHEQILKMSDGVDLNLKDFEFFISQRSYLWRIYGKFSPSPLGALALSDELPFLHSLIENSEKNFAYQNLAFLYRRLGNFELAIHYSKKSINYESSVDIIESKLELAISLFLQKKIYEAKKVIEPLINIGEHRALPSIHYWFHRINEFKFTLANNDLLAYAKSNPLLLLEYLKNFPKVKLDFYETLKANFKKDRSLFDQECLIFFLIEDGFFDVEIINEYLVLSALEEFIVKWKNELMLRSVALSKLLIIFEKNKIINMLSVDNSISLTSEMMAIIFSKFTIFSSFINVNNIKIYEDRINNLKTNEYQEAIHNIMCEDYIIKDSNTSNYHARFYSLNLRINGLIYNFVQKEVGQLIYQCFQKIKFQFLEIGIEIGDDYDIWFDASWTYGGSKINNHLHTASYKRSFLSTIVLYLCVPEAKLGEGDILIHASDKDILLKPVTGLAINFPPWFYHETTPINAGDLRVTINIDIFSKEQILIPLEVLNCSN